MDSPSKRTRSRSTTASSGLHRVLVTGSNGFVGGNLVRQLKEKGLFVRGFDIVPKPKDSLLDDFVQGDLTKPDDCDKALTDIDTVFHVAALIKGPQDLIERVNVGGAKILIATSQKRGVRRFVYTSSASVVFAGKNIENGTEDLPYAGPELDPYNYTKAQAEKLILEANGSDNGTAEGLRTVAIRPHSIYGPGDQHAFPVAIANARAGRLRVKFTSDEWLSSYTFVDNVSHALILAAEALVRPDSPAAGKAYNVHDGDNARFWDRLYQIGELGGVKRSSMGAFRLPIPFPVLYGIAWLFWSVGLPLGTFTPFVLSLASTHHYYSIEAAKRDLKYAPVMDPKKSWELTKDYFRDWAKRNPAPPPKPRTPLPLLAGFLLVAAYFARVQWVGNLDVVAE